MASSVVADCIDRAKALGIELNPDMVERTTRDFIAMGKSYSAMDYACGDNADQTAAVTIAHFMPRYDVILSPTLSAPPLPLGRIGLDTGRTMMGWGREVGTFTAFCGIYNGTGQPSMSLVKGRPAHRRDGHRALW